MDVPTISIKKTYKYNQIEFWAEGGLIRIHDGRDGSDKSEPISVMRKRAKALFEESSRVQHQDEKSQIIAAARDIMLCIQEAKEQGDPTDAKVIKDLAHDNRRIWSTGASVTNSGIILG
jgi:hypothetical protein